MRVVKEIAQTHGKSLPYLLIHFIYARNLCATGNASLQAHGLLAVASCCGAMDSRTRKKRVGKFPIRIENTLSCAIPLGALLITEQLRITIAELSSARADCKLIVSLQVGHTSCEDFEAQNAEESLYESYRPSIGLFQRQVRGAETFGAQTNSGVG